MEIDFDKLLRDYNSELTTKLRGFNDQFDYLQYWVPGSDKTRSLMNLIDAMHETRIFNFSVLILKEDNYLVEEIKNISEDIGQSKISLDKEIYKVSISLDKLKYQTFKKKGIKVKKISIKKSSIKLRKLNNNRESYDLLKDYETNLLNYNLTLNKETYEIEENVFTEFVNKKNKIFVKIDQISKKIISCWHDCEEKNNTSIVIDKFCKIVQNKGIQEASEHGTIYLEHFLRPLEIAQKIKGVVLPKKAGGVFFDLNECIRKIYIKAKKKYNFDDAINKEYFDLSKDWLKIPYEEKLKKLNEILYKEIIPKLSLINNDISIEEIEHNTKVVVRTSSDFIKKNSGKKNYLIMIEDLLKQLIDSRLELFTIEKMDDNKLRHVNSPQKI